MMDTIIVRIYPQYIYVDVLRSLTILCSMDTTILYDWLLGCTHKFHKLSRENDIIQHPYTMMVYIRIENEIRSHFCRVKNVIQTMVLFGHTNMVIDNENVC